MTLDSTTGAGTFVGPIGNSLASSLVFDPSSATLFGTGRIPGTSANGLIEIDPETGMFSPIGTFFGSANSQVNGLAIDSATNTLFGSDIDNDQIITIDRNTGVGTIVGPVGFDNVNGLTYDSVTDTLFGYDGGSSQFISIDKETGAGTAISQPDEAFFITALTFDASSGVFFANDVFSGQLLSASPITGETVVIGQAGLSPLVGLAFAPVTIPEPSSPAFFGFVACLFAVRARRRSHS